MNEGCQENKIRQMDSGSWYWASKTVIREYASEVGFLAIAVYHFLASMVDENQSCYPSQKYIAERLGCSRSSVSRSVKVLNEHRLIRLTVGARNHRVYYLLKVEGCTEGKKMTHRRNSDVAPVDTNNTKLTRIDNNVVGVSPKKPLNGTLPNAREELLASDIAAALGDSGNPQRYVSYARRYQEPLIRQVLSELKSTPDERIRESRAALFAYLINYYAKERS